MDIDTCVENFSGAILGALEVSTPKRRPIGDPRPQIPAVIQDEIRLKNRLRRCSQVSRDPALKTNVNRLQRSVTRRLNEWRNDQWSATLKSLNPEDQSPWKMTKRVMRDPTPSPPGHPWGNRSLRLWESWSPRRQFGGSVSAGHRSFGPGRYWDGWRVAGVVPPDPCQRTKVDQPWPVSTRHQGPQSGQMLRLWRTKKYPWTKTDVHSEI